MRLALLKSDSFNVASLSPKYIHPLSVRPLYMRHILEMVREDNN